MYAQDRVLVGVVKRAQDLRCAREGGWYRIPLSKWRGEETEYLALFLNGKMRKLWAGAGGALARKPRPCTSLVGRGAICYFAEVLGYELAYRYQLLPQETDHPRAREVYCCLKLGYLQERLPPIVNDGGHRFSFIRTNWERFTHARRISQLFGDRSLALTWSA